MPYGNGLRGNHTTLRPADAVSLEVRRLQDIRLLDAMTEIVRRINIAASEAKWFITVDEDELDHDQISLLRRMGYIVDPMQEDIFTICWTREV